MKFRTVMWLVLFLPLLLWPLARTVFNVVAKSIATVARWGNEPLPPHDEEPKQ